MIRIVTGTGFGVGKTAVAAALIRAEQNAGRSAGYYKPVDTNCGSAHEGDAEFIRAAVGVPTGEGYRFDTNLDPAIAAAQSATTISMDWIVGQTRTLAGRVDVLYVESTGGLLTPISDSLTIADLASRVGVDVIVVTRLGIGTLNAGATTLEALRGRALGFAGFMVNRWPANPGVMERTTLDRLMKMGTVLGLLPEVEGLDTHRPRTLPDGFELLSPGDVPLR